MVDIHIKFLVDHTIRTVREDPENRVPEIFGDARLDPHAALYGDRMLNDIKTWIAQTEIPVLLGFDLEDTQIPGVTVNLEGSSPQQPFMGDQGHVLSVPLQPHEKTVIVEKFSPKLVELDSGGSFYTITLPDSMPTEQSDLVQPGMRWRDKNGKEFAIGQDGLDLTAYEFMGMYAGKLASADLSEIEVIAPFDDARYREGVMYYEENALITVHGHSDRPEGLWLWAIVQWGILKFRPLLTSTFGLDLAMPRASDFAKADEFLGTNIWRRFITLQAKTVWSWQSNRQKDIAGFLYSIKACQKNGISDPVDLTDIE